MCLSLSRTDTVFLHIVRKKEFFMGRLVIDGENVYELDEECLREKRKKEEEKEKSLQNKDKNKRN